jgi:ribosomal protein S18 acetylase RimI-like enzyme
MEVTLADPGRVREIAELFNDYRSFYQQESDIAGAVEFLQARFEKKDSVIFTANDGSRLAGFVQLYPSFSSVSMKHIWILNDLFVAQPYRRKTTAKQLMETAKKHAQSTGALRLQCSTQSSNIPAQRLYESLGYLKDEVFYHYALSMEQ